MYAVLKMIQIRLGLKAMLVQSYWLLVSAGFTADLNRHKTQTRIHVSGSDDCFFRKGAHWTTAAATTFRSKVSDDWALVRNIASLRVSAIAAIAAVSDQLSVNTQLCCPEMRMTSFRPSGGGSTLTAAPSSSVNTTSIMQRKPS